MSCVEALRVPGSPYPVPSKGLNSTSQLVYVIDGSLPPSDILTVNTLQGLLGRVQPAIYIDSGASYQLWMDILGRTWSVQFDTRFRKDVPNLIKTFSDRVSGYVLANLGDSSTSAALTLCATKEGLVVATPENQATLVAAGIPLAYDVRSWNVSYVISRYNTSLNPRITVLQDPTKYRCLSDWGVFGRAVTWWDKNMKSSLAQTVLSSLTVNSAVFGWGSDEGQTVLECSKYGSFVHASDWAYNLATLSSFDLPKLTQRASLAKEPTSLEKVHTVAFLMTDGDNIQWMLNDFAVKSQWWNATARGSFPLGWTFPPALVDLSPATAFHLYSTATLNDFFVAAPSGVGYTNPDIFGPSNLKAYADLTGRYMEKCDLKLLNIIGDTYSPSAATALLAHPQVDALLWYDYYSYAALQGNVTWLSTPAGPKPVIGARFQLWSGVFDTPASLVKKLQDQSKDPTSAAGYSLIDVEVWTNSVEDVAGVVKALQDVGGFRVVSPGQLVKDINTNVPH